MSLLTELTEATCGFNCWLAKEHICRCSCGGKNHGIMLKEGQKWAELQPFKDQRRRPYLLFIKREAAATVLA